MSDGGFGISFLTSATKESPPESMVQLAVLRAFARLRAMGRPPVSARALSARDPPDVL